MNETKNGGQNQLITNKKSECIDIHICFPKNISEVCLALWFVNYGAVFYIGLAGIWSQVTEVGSTPRTQLCDRG